MRFPTLALFGFLAVTTFRLPAAGAPAEPSAAQSEILAVERARFAAMTSGDLAALAPMLATDLVYTHTDGCGDTRASLLAALETHAVAYESIEPSDMIARIVGDVAILTGRIAMRVRAGERQIQFSARFIEIYEQREGRWQLTHWQSTRLPEPP